MVGHEKVFAAFAGAVQSEVDAQGKTEEVFKTIRAGGPRAVIAFVHMAEQARKGGGKERLAQWIDDALGLLPEADMKTIMVRAMECFLDDWEKQKRGGGGNKG